MPTASSSPRSTPSCAPRCAACSTLTPEEVEDLVQLAERQSREAISIFEFTRLVDEGLPQEEKKRIVELLWLVCFADAEKHAEEEYLVRKIAGLLHVTHPEFIDAKIRAREASQRKSKAWSATDVHGLLGSDELRTCTATSTSTKRRLESRNGFDAAERGRDRVRVRARPSRFQPPLVSTRRARARSHR